MTARRVSVVTASLFLLGGAVALLMVLLASSSSGSASVRPAKAGPGEARASAEATVESAESPVKEGPTSYEEYRAMMRTYPAKSISPAVVARTKATFNRIAARDLRRLRTSKRFSFDSGHWNFYGPRQSATEPGVLSFTGATDDT